jgi:hypothetical protein
VLVQPATVERWRRDRCNRHWWRRSRLPGRPRIDSACRDLIGRLAEENALRGAPRIHGELLKLGVIVSERTVSRYLRERPKRPSHRLGAHSWQIISASSHSIPRRCHDTRRTLTMSPTCPVCHVAKRGCHAMRCTPFIRGAVVEWRDLRQPISSRRCPIHDRVDDGLAIRNRSGRGPPRQRGLPSLACTSQKRLILVSLRRSPGDDRSRSRLDLIGRRHRKA